MVGSGVGSTTAGFDGPGNTSPPLLAPSCLTCTALECRWASSANAQGSPVNGCGRLPGKKVCRRADLSCDEPASAAATNSGRSGCERHAASMMLGRWRAHGGWSSSRGSSIAPGASGGRAPPSPRLPLPTAFPANPCRGTSISGARAWGGSHGGHDVPALVCRSIAARCWRPRLRSSRPS